MNNILNYQIEVTNEDIFTGKRGVCGQCPIALAITRTLKSRNILVKNIEVFRQAIFICTERYQYKMFNPQKINNFVTRFDLGETVQPFTFKLTAIKQ